MKGQILGSLNCFDVEHVSKYKVPVVAFGVPRIEKNYYVSDERVIIDDLLILKKLLTSLFY